VALGVDTIPKKPSDHVQIVRFELQEKEREMIESALVTWQVSRAANSTSQMVEAFDKLLSLENAYLLVTAYEMYTGQEILPGTPNDIYKLIEWLKEWWNSSDVQQKKDVAEFTGYRLFDFFRLATERGFEEGEAGFGG